jgi:hypothetical protein
MTLIILVPLHWLLKATTGTGVRVSEEARSLLLLFIIYFKETIGTGVRCASLRRGGY